MSLPRPSRLRKLQTLRLPRHAIKPLLPQQYLFDLLYLQVLSRVTRITYVSGRTVPDIHILNLSSAQLKFRPQLEH